MVWQKGKFLRVLYCRAGDETGGLDLEGGRSGRFSGGCSLWVSRRHLLELELGKSNQANPLLS